MVSWTLVNMVQNFSPPEAARTGKKQNFNKPLRNMHIKITRNVLEIYQDLILNEKNIYIYITKIKIYANKGMNCTQIGKQKTSN